MNAGFANIRIQRSQLEPRVVVVSDAEDGFQWEFHDVPSRGLSDMRQNREVYGGECRV